MGEEILSVVTYFSSGDKMKGMQDCLIVFVSLGIRTTILGRR